MANVRIQQLPEDLAPIDTDVVAVDSTLGGTTRRVPIPNLGDLVRPLASQPEAEAGSNNTKTMTPLRAAEATQANVFPTRAELLARNLPAVQTRVRTSGEMAGEYAADPSDPDNPEKFQTPDGRTWVLEQDIWEGRLSDRAKRYLQVPPRPSARWSSNYSVMFRGLETRSISRVIPVQYLKFGDTHCLLAVTRHFKVASSWGSSLFFSDDLLHWREGRANPIFNQIEHTWQGERAMAQALVWDHQEERWAMVFSADGSTAIQAPPYNSQGIRAVGLAYSDNLENGGWDIEPDPILLVENASILTWYGSSAARVYCAGIPVWREKDGLWYMPVTVGEATGGQPFKTGLVKAATLRGPWSSIATNPILQGDGSAWEANQAVGNSWERLADGSWWMPYKGSSGKIGLARYWGDDLNNSVWTKTADPIIEPDYVVDRTVLVPTAHGFRLIGSSDNGGANLITSWAESSFGDAIQSDPIGGRYAWPSGYRDGLYYFPPYGKISTTTVTVTAGTLYVAPPLPVARPVRIQALVNHVTEGAAGSVVFGLYTNRNGYPGEKIFQTTAASTASIGTVEPTVDTIVAPGVYWLVALFEGAPTVRAFVSGDSMSDAPYGWASANPTTLSGRSGYTAPLAYTATLPDLFPGGASGGSLFNLPLLGFKAKDFAV